MSDYFVTIKVDTEKPQMDLTAFRDIQKTICAILRYTIRQYEIQEEISRDLVNKNEQAGR